MRLPKKLMEFLKSKRLRVALAWSPFLAAALLAASYAGLNRYGRWALDRTIEGLIERGFPRTMEEAIGPAPPDEENLFKHSAVLAEMEKRRWIWRADQALEGFEKQHPDGHSWLDWTDFAGDLGRQEAREGLKALAPFEETRDGIVDAFSRCRPWSAGYTNHSPEDQVLSRMPQVKMFLDQHGLLCLAAGERERAFEDFVAALKFDASLQTLAIHGYISGDSCYQFEDTLRAALMESPPGIWEDEQLAVFDEILRGACSGNMTMKFQRLYVTLLIELDERVNHDRLSIPPQQSWADWRQDWEWQHAPEQLAEAWEIAKPHGLRDLEISRGLQSLAEGIESVGMPTDWARVFREGDRRYHLLERFELQAEAVANLYGDIDAVDPPVYDSSHAYSEGQEFEGVVWTRLGRWGIALERHRLRHGRHPSSLAELDADLRIDLPQDPLSKVSFDYRPTADGGYQLRGVTPRWAKDDDYLWQRRGD